MKRLFFVMMMAYIVQLATAQVTLQPSVPTVGLIHKDQLWNMLIVNSTANSYDCRLELVLQDRTTGQEVLTATTAFFRVSPGGIQLNVNTVNPVQYTYIVAGTGSRLQSLIPAGNYTACYALISRAIVGRPLAEECVQFDCEPLSPPILIFPADSSVLENTPVQFSWMPPTPDGMFNQLKYEIVITSINDGQKANEALQQNIPLFSDGNLLTNVFNYPTSATTLDKNKWYAWQIIARDDRNYAGKSETWTFKIKTDTIHRATLDNYPYILIKNNKDATEGIHNITANTLRFKYYSFDIEHEGIIKFLNSKGKVVLEVKQKIIYGDNYFSFKIGNTFKKRQIYSVVIPDNQNNNQTALFSIQ